MKALMKASLTLLAGVAFALQGSGASAQVTGVDQGRKPADFASKERAMQDASRSSASGAVASPTTPAV